MRHEIMVSKAKHKRKHYKHRSSRMHHRHHKNPKKWYVGVFELILLLALTPLLYTIAWYVAALYVVALVGAVRSKIIFRKKGFFFLMIAGTAITYAVGLFIPYVLSMYKAGDILSAALMAIVMILIWYAGFRMKKGE